MRKKQAKNTSLEKKNEKFSQKTLAKNSSKNTRSEKNRRQVDPIILNLKEIHIKIHSQKRIHTKNFCKKKMREKIH